MSQVAITRKGNIITVRTKYWEVEHDAKAGGCWTSVKFTHGTGKNLLAGPVSSRVRNLDPNPKTDAASPFFYETKFDKNPKISTENTSNGAAVVVEGTYRLESGEDIGVNFRQRYEYRDWGLVACELDLICPDGRKDIVEVVAVECNLREGMTDAYVREHPIRAGSSDLLGMGKWLKLSRSEATYSSRYIPNHIVCFEKGKEGIEFTCSSDIGGWDTACNSDAGLGLYEVRPSWGNAAHTLISICPYCVAYRRNPTELKGTRRLRYYLGLPFIKAKEDVGSPYLHAGTDSHWLSDPELEVLANSGVKLIRFHNDYREDGPFWHDGMYPPYDELGMAQLRRIINTTHRLGMKIVPYISVKEFHPDTPGCKENQAEWRQQPGPTFPELHTWYGSGEFGQLMCLESGWLDFRKRSIEIILGDLPWDGLYFDWCTPHNCRNPKHNGGGIHSDQDAFYDFMFWVRQRVGPAGIIMTHLSGFPQIVVENLADISLIFEDQNYTAPFPEPPNFPIQCEFIPITPRHLCAAPAIAGLPGPNAGSDSRRTIMSGFLQGHPGIVHAIGGQSWDPLAQKMTSFSAELLSEGRRLGGEDLSAYRFSAATQRAVGTGQEKVYGAIWHKKGKALVYLGNYAPKAAKGAFQLDPKLIGMNGSTKLKIRHAGAPKKSKALGLKSAALKSKGVPYALKGWGTEVFVIEAE